MTRTLRHVGFVPGRDSHALQQKHFSRGQVVTPPCEISATQLGAEERIEKLKAFALAERIGGDASGKARH